MGKEGQDGSNGNFSWNCGVEGETNEVAVNAIRERQVRNFQLALMLSQGTPMILMGDEYGHTRNGNNNSYGFDTDINHFQWSRLEEKRQSQFWFFAMTIKLRREHPLLGRQSFSQMLTSHGMNTTGITQRAASSLLPCTRAATQDVETSLQHSMHILIL